MNLSMEVTSGKKVDIEAELGDLFFTLINAARLYEIDPESCPGKDKQEIHQQVQLSGAEDSCKGTVIA